ncbi:MAG: hypothetical protein KIT84_30915 [Labilithrix sp.]|nr:hypothetical protein [Labilithrix sp.]MCW5815480.1 hypothetical protein [Labilithrix sp.]
MKRTILGLVAISTLLLSACGEDPDQLTGGAGTRAPNRTPSTQIPDTPEQTSKATAGSESSTFDHSNDPAGATAEFEPTDPAQVRAVGSPEVTSRLHGCGKLSVASIGQLITSRGIGGGGQRPQNTQSGADIFRQGPTAAALGAANYNGRVPEAPFASTSAISKMYDIFAMASYDVVADNWEAPACPGVKVLEAGKFTKDGISCLIGKPATDEYVAIANDAIVKSPNDGAKIAIAAMLSAAHTCQ